MALLFSLGLNLEEDLQHHWHPKWKAGNTKNHSDRQLVLSKDIAQQLGSSVSHLRQRQEVLLSCQVRGQLDNPGHLIEGAEMLSRDGEYVQRRNACRFPSLFDVVLSTQPADELRYMPDDRQNAAEMKHSARLDTFNIRTKGSGRGRQLNAELRQPALRGSRLRTLRAHHLLECAPPSTCSTSPVT